MRRESRGAPDELTLTAESAATRSLPRLVVSDLDGTLLTSAKTVSATTVTALSRARDAGMRIAVATARPHRLIGSVLPASVASLLDAVIVSNGAAVIDGASGDLLHEDVLTPAECAAALAVLRTEWPDAGFGWESGTEFSSDAALLRLTESEPILRDPHPDRVAEAPSVGAHQLVMAVPAMLPLALVARAAALLGDRFAVTESQGGVVEISSARVSKASAAAWWADSLGDGTTLDAAVAFGDGHNDLPLLMTAGIGVAMGNASAAVRAAVPNVTATNDDDGVARYLLEVLARGQRAGTLAESGAPSTAQGGVGAHRDLRA